jgi:hypothetical protein
MTNLRVGLLAVALALGALAVAPSASANHCVSQPAADEAFCRAVTAAISFTAPGFCLLNTAPVFWVENCQPSPSTIAVACEEAAGSSSITANLCPA